MKRFDKLAIIVLVLAAALLFYRIDKPFWGQFDWTGAWFGTIARNYLELDPRATKLAPITVAGTTNPSDWSYYNHYPITYPLLVAGSMVIFGDHEWSIRLVSAVFSILTLGAFYTLCRRFFHPLVGLFGMISILITPMFIYYGKLPVHEQPVLFFSLLALYFYLAKRFNLMTLSVVLAFAASWTGAYMLLLISAHAFWLQRKKIWRLAPAYLLCGGIVVLHFWHIYLSSDITDFGKAVVERTMSGGSPLVFVVKQIRWFLADFTRPLTLVALFSLIKWHYPVLIMFFVWGFFQWVVVNRIMWIHDYMLIYFLPFVALGNGVFFWQMFRKSRLFGLIALVGILSLSIYSSLPFTRALLDSKDQTADLYYLAASIKSHSVYGDKVTINLPPGSDFATHYPIHYLSYYANRYIKYQFSLSDSEVVRIERL